MSMIGDVTLDALQMGLRGLNQRRQVAEDAVSNMETPGYVASNVSFEDQLADAIASGDPTTATTAVTATTDPALPNGNNVQVDQELVGLSETALKQQLLVEGVNAKFRLLRTVITG
jgi:flagellar basal-body rod protein FlgB